MVSDVIPFEKHISVLGMHLIMESRARLVREVSFSLGGLAGAFCEKGVPIRPQSVICIRQDAR